MLSAGVNKGDKVPTQLAELLQGKSRISSAEVDLSAPDYDTDVLIIGGGGAGSSAAIEAHEAGADDGDCTTAIICKHCTKVAVAGNASHTPNSDDGDCTTAITCKDCGTVTTAGKANHTPT